MSLRNWLNNLPVPLLKLCINLWPPFLGAGIKVKTIAKDYLYIQVAMKLHWYNQNYVGIHFGGSMFAMTDPFYMLMLIKNLGPGYIVLDKGATIDFKKPGRGLITATFNFTTDEINTIRQQADQKEKYIFDRPIDIINQEGVVVATIVKTLYVRKKAVTI